MTLLEGEKANSGIDVIPQAFQFAYFFDFMLSVNRRECGESLRRLHFVNSWEVKLMRTLASPLIRGLSEGSHWTGK